MQGIQAINAQLGHCDVENDRAIDAELLMTDVCADCRRF